MARRNNRNNRLLVGRLALLACLVLCLVMGAAMAMRRDAFALTSDAAATAASKRNHSGIGVLANDTFVLTHNSVEQTLEAGEGEDYQITVDCPDTAGIPKGAKLKVKEITEDSSEYDIYLAQASEALGVDPSFIRLFDITIKSGRREIEPVDTVEVTIELPDAELSDEAVAMHFTDDGPEIMDATNDGTTMDFETESFSVYAIVDVEPPAEGGQASVVDDLLEENVYILSIYRNKTNYLNSEIIKNGGVYEIKGTTNEKNAVGWHFKKVGEGTYNLYYVDDDGVSQYLNVDNSRNISFSADGGTDLTVETTTGAPDTFYIYRKIGGNNYALSVRGSGYFFFERRDNGAHANERVVITQTAGDDPYELDSMTYGIAYHNDTIAAAALMAESKDANHLKATDMLMKPDVLDNEGILLVAENSDITEWTFHGKEEATYTISAVVDGSNKYLNLNGGKLTLVDGESDATIFTLLPGTGANAGKFQLKAGNYYIQLEGQDSTKGFNGVNSPNAATWLNFVEKSVLGDDDFKLYQAQKVSVSDEVNVYSGQQVVIYTRVWNDTTKRYEFYAVDHDGSLIRCYDTGDNIEWTGSKVNTALWKFTDYVDEEGNTTNYYELQNVQYDDVFLAPSLANQTVISGAEIGLNLNGRRYGRAYTNIVAWDDKNYSFAGLKVKDGHVVACPVSQADDFYFAVVTPVDPDDELSEVATVDSEQYGITMKMIDFNNAVTGGNRDSVQDPFMGSTGYVETKPTTGLLSTDIGEDGYPTTTSRTGHEDSLGNLFNNMTDVNNLFIQSIYSESGYFEFDSTSNFAHLEDDGNFTVYDQIAAFDNDKGKTRTHGQFMPYNSIYPGRYAHDSEGNLITNTTNVLAQELPDTDPRKGEKLYSLGYSKPSSVDYFFGMEMSASFTQTASGLDAWGHDIIFEFSGDDDFWLYVDDELVLDLGGVHQALEGSVNFRTGVVINSGTRTTLYEVFKKNYQTRGLSDSEINTKLGKIFVKNSEGNYVFTDYSQHTMKMFYMERGAGASNLHMRFNLAAVKPGTLVLSKELTGTDNPQNDLIEFPYQIWYENSKTGQLQLLGAEEGDTDLVTYENSTDKVKYAESFTPAGGTKAYEHVFFLKPGQSAVVDLPDDIENYYVVECGVNPDIYDQVKANGEELTGKNTSNKVGKTARKDYAIEPDTLQNRNKVDFQNHVKDGAMRTLEITKVLYDVDGKTKLTYDDNNTPFAFRLYLGDENADADDLPLANMYDYCIKDKNDVYCRWDASAEKFVSTGITDYATLVQTYANNLESVVFTTSINGTISKIPAEHTVEVRDLIVSTQYKVEERLGDIPKGYTLRLGDGYTRVDVDPDIENGTTPYANTIKVNETPEIEVRNQKGWGLTVKKVWTDKDFMEKHDSIYFAVYVKSNDGNQLTLLDDSVRELKTKNSSVYYFFGTLKNTIPFANYIVREVTLEGDDITPDKNGVVSGYTKVTPIEDGDTLNIDGQPVGGQYSTGNAYTYTVTYQPGEQTTTNENVRTDTVTNSRPGIKLYKSKWDATTPLAGATFTLKDKDGNNVAADSYTSREEDGLVTIVYVSPGVYTLTETKTPKGYTALDNSINIHVAEHGKVVVTGVDGKFYKLEQASGTDMASLTIKNRTSNLVAKKIDATTNKPIEGAHFALYRQVKDSDGNPRKDYYPMEGYEDLVTDAEGIIPNITLDLKNGTYYLVETAAAAEYDCLENDLCFTIGSDGTVKYESGGNASWFNDRDNGEGGKTYTIKIPNGKMKKVSFKKVDVASNDVALEGAEFDLYAVNEDGEREEVPLISGLRSGADGMLSKQNDKIFQLAAGTYELLETKAPKGYNLKEKAVVIIVPNGGEAVTYTEGTSLSDSNKGVVAVDENGIYLLLITNTSGYELPATGGTGVVGLYVLGAALVIGALIGLRRQYA